MLTIPRSFERLETARIFSPYTHSPYTISRFTSYLKLLLLPEVKYGERLLPVGKKKLRVYQSLGSLTIPRVVPPLPVVLADDVRQKVWLSLIIKQGGAYPQNSLSFLASSGKRTNHSRAYLYGRRDDRNFKYIYGHRVKRVNTLIYHDKADLYALT